MKPDRDRTARPAGAGPWRTADDLAGHRARLPVEARGILDRRSLATSHRRLAALLAPGLRVLDVGCGTGAITRGIAERVVPGGRAVGLDVSDGLIADARRQHRGVPGLQFVLGDVYRLPAAGAFDIVTAARLFQWLAEPLAALRAMRGAAKPGGRLVVLDYNHEKIVWKPLPPPSVQKFYAAFLGWRTDAGMDNAVADHLSELFVKANLTDVLATPQHETSCRGDADFPVRAGIWAEVAATRGHQMVADGAIDEADRARAEREYRGWLRETAQEQTMYLLAVEGRRRGRRAP
jgi:SAM-dependent methyltransferase